MERKNQYSLIIWVLERGYKYNNTQITSALKNILSVEEFSFEYKDVLWLALKEYENRKFDYSDILIGKLNNIIYKYDVTITFDKIASKLDEFKLIGH